jgi:FkbH-like protein
MEADDQLFTLQIRLRDRFGDNGMISVVICRERKGSVWEIDTWLMSCRVLGRRVEHAVLNYLTNECRDRGVLRLIGEYIPTAKNALVKDHYTKLGFQPTEISDELTRYELDVDAAQQYEVPIRSEN